MDKDVINILVIDENPENNNQVKHLLSECRDFKIHYAISLRDGLSFLKSGICDIVLLQLTIGLDSINEIRRIKPEMPVIVLGWINDESSIEEILMSGASDYLLEYDLQENQIRRAIKFTLARSKGQIAPLRWTTTLVNKLHLMENLYKLITENQHESREMIKSILKVGCQLFGESIGIFSHIKNGRYEIEQVYADNNLAKQGQVFDLKKTFCSISMETDKPVIIDAVRNPKWKKHAGYLNTGLLSYLGIKVYKDDKPYGTLSFSSPAAREEPFLDSDLDFMRTLSLWMRNIISQSHTSIDSELLDMHDPVTGLMNHDTFIEDLESCINRAAKANYYYFAVMFFDICNYHEIKTMMDVKQANNFMKLIGKRLKSQLRPRDTIARFSETTFVLLLEDVYINETSFAAERIIAEIQKPISLGNNIINVVPSIGIAMSSSYKKTDHLLHDAETAISNAKQSGQTFYVINPEHIETLGATGTEQNA